MLGQVVIKLNGRFAGYYGVVVKENDSEIIVGIPLDDNTLKEKKSNIKHVVPVPGKVIDKSKLSDKKALIEAFKKLGFVPGKRIRV